MLLARAGARVLLVDRARFPSDTVSGHAIKQTGVAYLKRWGLLDAVLATGCPPIYKLQIGIGDRVLPGPPPEPDTLPIVGPRRTVLDMTLIQAAASAGVDVQVRTTVSGLLHDGDHVVGIQALSNTGRPLRAVAPIVIGADGKQSWIAQQVGAEYEHYQPPVSFAYYSYWSGARVDGIAMYFAPGRAAGMLPTNDGQVLAFVQGRWNERHAFRTDVVGNYRAWLNGFPAVAEALAGAMHEGPIRGMLDLPVIFGSRTARAGRWPGMLPTTKTRSSPAASPMPSATLISWPERSGRVSAARRISSPRSRTTSTCARRRRTR